jgi:hypothetical protein
MITTPAEFREAIAFETLVLDRVLPVLPGGYNLSIDLRGAGTLHLHSVSESLCSGTEESIINDLTPLLFGAAWKILDLCVELTLNKAGIKADKKKGTEWYIETKCKEAKGAAGDYQLLTGDHNVWTAVTALYANTVVHRHCLVHRTVTVDPHSRALGGKDEAGNRITRLTLEEQKSIAKVALLIAEGIVSGGITSRNEDHLKYLLDQLVPHTLQQAFSVTKQGPPVEILINLGIENDGTLFVDTTAAREEASKASPSNSHFNLIMDIPDGSGRKFRAHLEDVPIGRTVVDVDNLPAWLSFL